MERWTRGNASIALEHDVDGRKKTMQSVEREKAGGSGLAKGWLVDAPVFAPKRTATELQP